MAGLRKLCKLYGAVEIWQQGDRQKTRIVWDYARDEPIPEAEMTKERFAASEKAKYQLLKEARDIEIQEELEAFGHKF